MFKNATKLDKDYMCNYFGFSSAAYGWQPKDEEAKYLSQYLDLCAAINENYIGGISIDQIERSLDTDEKRFMFKRAQAKQFRYDIGNQRGAMIRGTDGRFDLCRDTISILKTIGLWQVARVTY